MDVLQTEEFLAEWRANNMPEKRSLGLLHEVIVRRSPSTNPSWFDGESRIIKILTPVTRQHVGTVHEVIVGGMTVHSHPKDYTRRDCTRVRPTAGPDL